MEQPSEKLLSYLNTRLLEMRSKQGLTMTGEPVPRQEEVETVAPEAPFFSWETLLGDIPADLLSPGGLAANLALGGMLPLAAGLSRPLFMAENITGIPGLMSLGKGLASVFGKKAAVSGYPRLPKTFTRAAKFEAPPSRKMGTPLEWQPKTAPPKDPLTGKPHPGVLRALMYGMSDVYEGLPGAAGKLPKTPPYRKTIVDVGRPPRAGTLWGEQFPERTARAAEIPGEIAPEVQTVLENIRGTYGRGEQTVEDLAGALERLLAKERRTTALTGAGQRVAKGYKARRRAEAPWEFIPQTGEWWSALATNEAKLDWMRKHPDLTPPWLEKELVEKVKKYKGKFLTEEGKVIGGGKPKPTVKRRLSPKKMPTSELITKEPVPSRQQLPPPGTRLPTPSKRLPPTPQSKYGPGPPGPELPRGKAQKAVKPEQKSWVQINRELFKKLWLMTALLGYPVGKEEVE